ncbi:SCO2400 family protein [Streptomyces sp. MN13]
MDYCSTCRRHLNGALVCPGCGAYAPDIAPPTADNHTAPPWDTDPAIAGDAPGTPHAAQPEAPDAGHDTPRHSETELDAGTSEASSTDAEGVPPAQQGRAARRRQLARWKKNKRRAAVATAVAIVGGGLSVVAMDRHSTDRAQAATAPDNHSMGKAQEQVPQPNATPPTSRTDDRPSRTPAEAETPSTDAARQQPHAAPVSATPPVARPTLAPPPNAQPAAAAPPLAVTAREPQQQTTARPPAAHDGGGTVAQQPAAPASPDDTDTDAGAPETSPAPASTEPAEVCLLVLCLG